MRIDVHHTGNTDPISAAIMAAIALNPAAIIGAVFFNQNGENSRCRESVSSIEELAQYWRDCRNDGYSQRYYACIIISSPANRPLAFSYTVYSFRDPLEFVYKWVKLCPALPVAIDWAGLPKGCTHLMDCHELTDAEWKSWVRSPSVRYGLDHVTREGCTRRAVNKGIELKAFYPTPPSRPQ